MTTWERSFRKACAAEARRLDKIAKKNQKEKDKCATDTASQR